MAGTTLAPPLRMPRAISQALMPTGIPATSRAVTLATQAQAGTRAMTTPTRATDLATKAVTQATQATRATVQAVVLETRAMVQGTRAMAQATRGATKAMTTSQAMGQDLAQVIVLSPLCLALHSCRHAMCLDKIHQDRANLMYASGCPYRWSILLVLTCSMIYALASTSLCKHATPFMLPLALHHDVCTSTNSRHN